MAIELHHLNTHGMMEQASDVLDGIVHLKARIAELEARNHDLEEELQELRGDKAQLEETVAVLQLNAKDKSVKDDEINAVHQKSLARLEELVNKEYPDKEEDHIESDGILCNMLDALGYNDLTEAWDKIDRWYC